MEDVLVRARKVLGLGCLFGYVLGTRDPNTGIRTKKSSAASKREIYKALERLGIVLHENAMNALAASPP